MDIQKNILKRVRGEKQLTLKQVNQETKIHIDVLKSIEEDRIQDINPVYLKGLIKIYAKFLGLDPEEVFKEYKEKGILPIKEEEEEENSKLIKKEQKRSFNLPKITKRIILPKLNKKKLKILLILLIGIIFMLFLVRGIKNIAKRKPAKEIPKKLEITAKKPSVNQNIILGLRAKQNSWVQVKVDDKIIFQNVLRKGQAESWEAEDKIQLWLGNAGGVELELNGKILPPLGRKGQVIKNIVITKNGITIGKK